MGPLLYESCFGIYILYFLPITFFIQIGSLVPNPKGLRNFVLNIGGDLGISALHASITSCASSLKMYLALYYD